MRLEWDFGGWFGSQLGGSAWILVAASISLLHDLATGLVLVALFLLPNVVGLLLWRRRNLSCYAAMQLVLALSGLCGLAAIFVLDRNRLWLAIQQGGAISSEAGYFLLSAVVLVVMLSLHLRYGRRPGRD